MPKKKLSIRISLVFLITALIIATAVTLLSFSAGFYRNSINWVLEVYTQNVTSHIIDKMKTGFDSKNEPENAKNIFNKVDISSNGKVFLIDSKDYIISSAEWTDGKLDPIRYENKKIKISEVNDSLIKKSFKKFMKNEKKRKRKFFKRKFDHYDFWHNMRKHVSIYKHFKVGKGEARIVAIIFPYRDFFKSMTRNNIILYSIAALFVLLAMFISMRISKRISTPLSILADEMEKIRNFELDSSPHIESPLEEVEKMSLAVDNMRSGLRSFKKYVPSDLVKELIHMNKEAVLGGERKNLTIFFSDIEGFTTISEKLSPEDLVEILGEYLKEMTEIVIEHKGTVDKYIGDSIMAFWGAPVEFSNHAELACKAALKYQYCLKELGKVWNSEGKPDFSSRIGLNTGDIIVGNMGYEKRMNYTVIGDPVNLASRLEAINKTYGTNIMLGEGTYDVVKDIMETRFLDIVAVKGKALGVKIYELISLKGEIDAERAKHRDQYEKALDLYLKREFEEAKVIFKEIVDQYDDRAAKVFFNRCLDFIKNPPDSDWKGVYIAKSK